MTTHYQNKRQEKTESLLLNADLLSCCVFLQANYTVLLKTMGEKIYYIASSYNFFTFLNYKVRLKSKIHTKQHGSFMIPFLI